MLEEVKMALRISNNAYNNEIKNLIDEEVCKLAPDPKTKTFDGIILKKVK